MINCIARFFSNELVCPKVICTPSCATNRFGDSLSTEIINFWKVAELSKSYRSKKEWLKLAIPTYPVIFNDCINSSAIAK
jgi:hypothetical protein